MVARLLAAARRLPGVVGGRLSAIWAHPLLNLSVLLEASRERLGGHSISPNHRPHLDEALAWLERAQDATADDGFARGYSLCRHPYFHARGWQPSYPETTGYIIPTLYCASRYLGRPDLGERATRAARWEIAVQLPSGAVRGGVMGEPESPAVFNTGQVILGWLSAFQETGEVAFADAAVRAGRFLTSTLEPDGHWRKGNSQFARGDATLYNARTAWALAEAGRRLQVPAFTAAAARHLRAVAALQAPNGWLPACCLSDPDRPLLHTLAYAIRGLLEGGRVLEDDRLIRHAERAARALAAAVRSDGRMAGRFYPDWSPAATWSCLTGQAQMANNWMRLFHINGDGTWLGPVPAVLAFLKSTQNRTSPNLGLRGGIKGSAPGSGEYGRYEVLNWATKFFTDALIRHECIVTGTASHVLADYPLA